MVEISLVGVTKTFGRTRALDNISLVVQPGQFLCLLGPSGCGKSTTLRIIAGFLVPDSGRVFIDRQDVTGVPPYRRDIGMVFQDYALFPHMSVLKNVLYGLKVRRLPPGEALSRCGEILRKVNLAEMASRYPRQLSGGQQQRVALARALVINPKVLLFDEPLSNLDAKLRTQMRVEIRKIQKEVGITAIFVTHDQEEALSISDRIAVMNDGRLEQVDSPEAIYNHPANTYVAAFIGKANFFDGQILAESSNSSHRRLVLVTQAGIRVRLGPNSAQVRPGLSGRVLVRPERLRLFSPENVSTRSVDSDALPGCILSRMRLGPLVEYVIETHGQSLIVHQEEVESRFSPGDNVIVEWLPEQSVFFPQPAG